MALWKNREPMTLTEILNLAWLLHGAETTVGAVDVAISTSSISTVELRFRW